MSEKVSKEAKDDGSWEYPADVMRPDGSTSKVFTKILMDLHIACGVRPQAKVSHG